MCEYVKFWHRVAEAEGVSNLYCYFSLWVNMESEKYLYIVWQAPLNLEKINLIQLKVFCYVLFCFYKHWEIQMKLSRRTVELIQVFYLLVLPESWVRKANEAHELRVFPKRVYFSCLTKQAKICWKKGVKGLVIFMKLNHCGGYNTAKEQ